MVQIPIGRRWRRGYLFGLFAASPWRIICQDLVVNFILASAADKNEPTVVDNRCAVARPMSLFSGVIKAIFPSSRFVMTHTDTKLLVVNNLTKFLKESKNKNSAQNKIASICTGDANVTSKGVIPKPIGGTFLKHAINVILHLTLCCSPFRI